MSPWWRDRLHIALCPQRVALLRLPRGLRARAGAEAVLPVSGDAAAGAPPWEAALAGLAAALRERRWQSAAARVVLSNHFVRYLLVPYDEKIRGEEEEAALVRHHFVQVYGEAAAGWDLRWSAPRPPAPSLACAIDRGLVAGLQTLFEAAPGLSLAAVQPYLMAAFNRWRRELAGGDWFLLAEEGRLCLAWFQNEDWAGIDCRQVGPAWGRELPQILQRTRLLALDRPAPGRLCLHAPATPAGEIVLAEGWSGQRLELPALPGLAPANAAAYAMALAG